MPPPPLALTALAALSLTALTTLPEATMSALTTIHPAALTVLTALSPHRPNHPGRPICSNLGFGTPSS